MKILHSSVIYENPLPQLKSVQSYFPFLCELDDGTILASHQLGEAFESVNGTTYLSKSTDGGKTWEAPYGVFDKTEDVVPTTNYCKISKADEKTLIMFGYEYFREDPTLPIGNPLTGGMLDDRIIVSYSKDNGKTWTPREGIDSKASPCVEASAPITVLQDGSWATPITNTQAWDGSVTLPITGRLLRSYDCGKTWNDDVVCMEFPQGNITCYEQRLCQLENGTIVVIGWNEDPVTGKLLNNHYTISTDNGKTFSAPMDTGIHGQASSVCAIGGNRLLALHALRREAEHPGVYGYVVDLSDGKWNIVDSQLLWAPAMPVVADKKMAAIFSFLKFGQPGAIQLADKSVLMSHWIQEEGQYKTICTRIEL